MRKLVLLLVCCLIITVQFCFSEQTLADTLAKDGQVLTLEFYTLQKDNGPIRPFISASLEFDGVKFRSLEEFVGGMRLDVANFPPPRHGGFVFQRFNRDGVKRMVSMVRKIHPNAGRLNVWKDMRKDLVVINNIDYNYKFHFLMTSENPIQPGITSALLRGISRSAMWNGAMVNTTWRLSTPCIPVILNRGRSIRQRISDVFQGGVEVLEDLWNAFGNIPPIPAPSFPRLGPQM